MTRRRADGLGPRGAAFYDFVAERYELDPVEELLTSEVARTVDLLAGLRAEIRRDGLTVAGSMGQPRAHPAVAAVAEHQRTLDGLLRRLRLRLTESQDEWDQLAHELSIPTPPLTTSRSE